MNLLIAEKITKSFAEKTLFNQISFGVNEGDKIGVIGINGTGKSTLLKIIAGLEETDSGTVTYNNGIRIGYLPQLPDFQSGINVINQVFKSDNPIMKIVKEYEETLIEAEAMPSSSIEKKLIDLSQQMDKLNAWNLQSEAKTILTKLGIKDFNKDVSLLSGGQRKRVAIATALITPVDLLILDEPTNHIDNYTIDWLENYLSKYNKSLLMVTHDRYFLDRVVNKTIELDKGKLYSYQGNYSQFLQLKAEREELEQSSETKRQNFLRSEIEWVRRGAQARSTKQKARLERFEEISDIKAPIEKSNIEINVGISRLGKKIIELNNVSKSFDGKCYIDNFSYMLLRNDRIGIIGSNGCGKSTLIKVMTNSLKPDKGNVEIGETVKIGLFSQENDDIKDDRRVIDYIKEIAEYIETSDGKISASQMLEKFLFTSDLQWSPVSKLSGGEKRRLYLLKVLMASPNILFLDEPTNDLDIETLTILENYLEGFAGAVVTVSHDRYFLDKCVDRIFAFEDNGKIKQYEGNYTDYSKRIASSEETIKAEVRTEKSSWNKGNKKLKMSYKEQREFETINDNIVKIERSIKDIENNILNIQSDYIKLQELTTQKDNLETELEITMERWLYLNELNEEIEKNKVIN